MSRFQQRAWPESAVERKPSHTTLNKPKQTPQRGFRLLVVLFIHPFTIGEYSKKERPRTSVDQPHNASTKNINLQVHNIHKKKEMSVSAKHAKINYCPFVRGI